MEGIDPYKVLHLNKKFTLEELKSSYKREVLRHHPDKSMRIDTTPQFQILTACYKMLLNEHNQRTGLREFHELKAGYEKEKQTHRPQNSTPIPAGKFNAARFNEDFEKHKFKDSVVEDGYNDWIKSTVRGETVIKPKVDPHAMTRYREPLPFSTGGAAYYPLGQNKLDDYSGENIHAKDLHFMDFKLAHSTERIIDPDKVKRRKEFRNVQELEAYREAQTRRPVTEADIARQKRHEIAKQRKEEERMARLNEYNRLIDEFHSKTQHLLLAGQGRT